MAKKPDVKTVPGICPYHDNLGCANKSACSGCGWNPESNVRERRIAAIMRDREESLRTGKTHLYL